MAERGREAAVGDGRRGPARGVAAALGAAVLAAGLATGARAQTAAERVEMIEGEIAAAGERLRGLAAELGRFGGCAGVDAGHPFVRAIGGAPVNRVMSLDALRGLLAQRYPEAQLEARMRIAARVAALQAKACENLLAQRQLEEARLAGLREWLAEERRELAQAAAGGPAGVFRSGQYAAGCLYDLEVAGAAIKGDLYCWDVFGLGRFPLGGEIVGETVRITAELRDWAWKDKPRQLRNEGTIRVVEPDKRWAYAAGTWTVGERRADGTTVEADWMLKPMDLEWPDTSRRPPVWSVYECRTLIKVREKDTDREAFDRCFNASRARHERPR